MPDAKISACNGAITRIRTSRRRPISRRASSMTGFAPRETRGTQSSPISYACSATPCRHGESGADPNYGHRRGGLGGLQEGERSQADPACGHRGDRGGRGKGKAPEQTEKQKIVDISLARKHLQIPKQRKSPYPGGRIRDGVFYLISSTKETYSRVERACRISLWDCFFSSLLVREIV